MYLIVSTAGALISIWGKIQGARCGWEAAFPMNGKTLIFEKKIAPRPRGVCRLSNIETIFSPPPGCREGQKFLTSRFLTWKERMLGTRRSSVTVAAGTLQKAGLIDYSRGRMKVESRKGLEQTACECYSIVHDEYLRLGLL